MNEILFVHIGDGDFFAIFFAIPGIIPTFAARNQRINVMESNTTTFQRPTPEEVRQMFRRAKAHQQQLEEEGRRMWEEEQRIKAEAKEYYELKTA